MRFLTARFRGLQGLYRNSMTKDVFINFEKCKHNIIYIVGPNGSGKSTLMSALTLLPDPPSMYLDRELGEKEILVDCNGTIYNIHIQYPVYANGSRATTKAFISEITPGGGKVELNPNGTVGSFKDIVYSRFSLDPNFMSLSFLSVEDRGIVEKKPSERKKFVANLLESLEVYNDIYKTLVKRSSVFKSMINSITAKIDSVGNQDKLVMDKASIDNRIAMLETRKTELESAISASAASINIIDPNNEIRNLYNELADQYNTIKSNISLLREQAKQFPVDTLDEATSLYLEEKQKESVLLSEINHINEEIQRYANDLEDENKSLFEKSQKLNALNDSIDFDAIGSTITALKEKIDSYEKLFKEIGITPGAVTKDEYIIGLNILENLRSSILNVKSYSSDNAISLACNHLLGKISIPNLIHQVEDEISYIESCIDSIKEEKAKYASLIEKTKILDSRPDSCSIDTCLFIRDALNASKQDPVNKLNDASKRYDNAISILQELKSRLDGFKMANKTYSDLNSVIRAFMNTRSIIEKLPISKNMFDMNYLVDIIMRGDPMNDIYRLYKYIDYANIFELYKNDSDNLKTLEIEQEKNNAKREIVDQLSRDIESIKNRIASINLSISSSKDKYNSMNSELSNVKGSIDNLDKVIASYRTIERYESEKAEIESKLNTVSSNIQKISAEVESINKNRSLLASVNQELSPLNQTRDNINYSLSKLKDYQAELNDYTSRYNTIELLKKYSSPTKGGIQTIFMQLYMDKTLSLANQLLSLVFGGKLELLPYIINENEFRIPTKSNVSNLIVDDVSNCSTSEKSMIAMTMSFALAFHGSPVYNIVRLDEIDGGLDQDNRAMFPIICRNMVDMLNIEQCFVISHSSESDMTDIDIISLYQDSWRLKGNVIFSL